MTIKTCPICGEKLQTWYQGDDWGVMEEGQRCHDCGYLDEFSYGGYRVIVDGQVWTYSYLTPNEKVEEINKEIEKAMKKAKAERKQTMEQRNIVFYNGSWWLFGGGPLEETTPRSGDVFNSGDRVGHAASGPKVLFESLEEMGLGYEPMDNQGTFIVIDPLVSGPQTGSEDRFVWGKGDVKIIKKGEEGHE